MTSRLLLSFAGRAAAAALTLALFVPATSAQCFGPDGLDSAPCCTPVLANLPPFPPLSMDADGICWNACMLSNETCIRLDLSPPVPITCSKYSAVLNVTDCAGLPLLKGTVTLDYLRTWTENAVPGAAPNQVWRFAAKVDLVGSAVASPLCPVPPCALTPGASAFYYGYVDYSQNCATSEFDGVIVLYHACDKFIHNPPFSSVPGSFHPAATYALVGPHTPMNPFVPTIMAPPGGILTAEAMRRVTPNPIGMCNAEEPVLQGIFQPLIAGCLCPLALVPPLQSGNHLSGTGMCGGAFKSLNLWPLTPWFELTTTSIGRWSNALSYPGTEHASVAEGLFVYADPCPNPTVPPTSSFDIFYGSLTQGGYLVAPSPIGLLTNRFLDLASNYSVPVVSPVVLPLFGRVGPTDHLIYVNF
jgi:hypothetical protein